MLKSILNSKPVMAGVTALMVMGPWTMAHAIDGQPHDWGVNYQDAATPIAEQIRSFHDFVLYLITAITIFVVALLLYVMVRFSEKSNPTPSKNSHNTFLEIAWTVIPILILLAISIPSFRLLFAQYDFPKADLVIKATGNQWYWSYEYPDHDEMSFDAIMLDEDERKEALEAGRIAPRLLAVDNEIVIPVNKVVHLLVTASDVIHNWAMPAFGSKIDAVPGRVTRTWFKVTRTGTFFGQCSELCGVNHAYMPIAVRVVSQEEFDAWLVKAKEEFATNTIGKSKNKVAEIGSEKVAALAN